MNIPKQTKINHDLSTLYPIASDSGQYLPIGDVRSNYASQWTGECRPPRAGEWFLSGSIVETYYTKDDLQNSYHIARIVKIERVEVIKVADPYPIVKGVPVEITAGPLAGAKGIVMAISSRTDNCMVKLTTQWEVYEVGEMVSVTCGEIKRAEIAT